MNENMIAFLQLLSDTLNQYVNKSENEKTKKRTFRLLGAKSGVSPSALSRWANGELKSLPNTTRVLNVLSVCCQSRKNAAFMMKDAYPDWWNYDGYLVKDNESDMSPDNTDVALKEIAIGKDERKILYKSYEPKGVKRSWVEEHMGKDGVVVLENMIEDGLLTYNAQNESFNAVGIDERKSGRVYVYSQNLMEQIKNDFEQAVPSLKNRVVGVCYSWLVTNKAGATRVNDAYRNFLQTIAAVDEESKTLDKDKTYVVKFSSARDIEEVNHD